MRPHVVDPGSGNREKNEILLIMRFPSAILSVRTIRPAGTRLLCKGETESESYANSESDADAVTNANAVTNAAADTEG